MSLNGRGNSDVGWRTPKTTSVTEGISL